MIDLAVLGLLAERPLHGYELRRRLVALAGSAGNFSAGSLYPALGRLEEAGAIASGAAARAEPGIPMTGSLGGERAAFGRTTAPPPAEADQGRRRRVYAITARGRARLARLFEDLLGPGLDDRSFSLGLTFAHLAPAGWLEAALAARTRTLEERRRDLLRSDARPLGVERELALLDAELAWLAGLRSTPLRPPALPARPAWAASDVPSLSRLRSVPWSTESRAGPGARPPAVPR